MKSIKLWIILILSLTMYHFLNNESLVKAQSPARQINVPYTNAVANIPVPERAILWFGKVTPTENYADVRAIYNSSKLVITVHIFDHKLWYDEHISSPDELTEWDAVTLYLNTNIPNNTVLTSGSYKFVGQLNHYQPRTAYQAAYRAINNQWQESAISFNTLSGWMGNGINEPTSDDRGWTITFEIPFASLGLTMPVQGTRWGLALVVHDRDDASGTAIPEQRYPETLVITNPSTWATLHFGIPAYIPGLITPQGTTTIRNGLDNTVVHDAQVGGFTTCGEPFFPNFFEGWGNATENDYEAFYGNQPGDPNPHVQINIQNQWNVTDWPCFSKYFISFPLDKIPSGKFIQSATLTLFQFGNADPGQAQPSFIQVHSVDGDWNADTLSWNNAPLAKENLGGIWVDVLQSQPPWPGVKQRWDVSRAVAEAYKTNKPLNLALYSADNNLHSGKYFTSSDMPDWDAEGRPTLTVVWGTLANITDRVYLPVVLR